MSADSLRETFRVYSPGRVLAFGKRDAVTTGFADAAAAAVARARAGHGPSFIEAKTYRYFDDETRAVDFGAMMEDLAQIHHGDIVLLHGCCHNPTGANLNHMIGRTILEAFPNLAGSGLPEAFAEVLTNRESKRWEKVWA